MPNPNRARRLMGNILLAAGLIILLGLAGYFGVTQLRAVELRKGLPQVTPVPTVALSPVELRETPVSAVEPTVTGPAATPQPPATAPSPTATTAEPAAAAFVPTDALATAGAPTVGPTEALPSPTPPATPVPLVVAAAPVRLVMSEPPIRIDTKVVPMGWEVVDTANGPRSEWVIPKNEAGHHINSALLGQPGNLVISGHNNIYGRVFEPISFAWDNDRRVAVDQYTDRSEVLNGRQIELYDAAGNVYTYVVTDFYRLRDTGVPVAQRVANGRFMGPTEDTRLTIITCWPPTNNTHRLVVIAVPAG